MQNIIITEPENLSLAINEGKKLAVFVINEQKNAISFVSGINVQKLPDFVKNNDITTPAIKYINENLNKELKLDTLADKCDVSKSYLCRLFAEKYGIGVNAYIIKLRMRKACKLLTETSAPVVNVAFDVGYHDCGYFHKLFKKHVGCTPLQYRENPTNVLFD